MVVVECLEQGAAMHPALSDGAMYPRPDANTVQGARW